METHVFVLHLVRAHARRDNAQDLVESCRDIGLTAEIWPAVDGSQLSATELAQTVGAELFEPAYPFPMKTGEVGCFLSHRQIWAELQIRNIDAALIIEDDADLDLINFPAAVMLAQRHIETLGYVQLQTRVAKNKSHLVDTEGDCRLFVPELGGLRTTGQMISKASAARLHALSQTIDRPVDTFVQSHWHTGLRPAMIYPSGIDDIAGELDGSTIQGSQKSMLEKLGRELARNRYRSGVARLSAHSAAPLTGGFAPAPPDDL